VTFWSESVNYCIMTVVSLLGLRDDQPLVIRTPEHSIKREEVRNFKASSDPFTTLDIRVRGMLCAELRLLIKSR